MNKVIGIIGSRRRDEQDDFNTVYNMFTKYYVYGDSICSGLCSKGGDRFAVIIANRLRLSDDKVIWYPADWETYGLSAGYLRNTDIAKTSDVLIACVSDDRKGGTEDTIKKFIKFHGKGFLIIV
jgi:hypothetical protein